MQLREIAHARTGDKGDASQISVVAYDPGDYAFLAKHLTAERVRAHIAAILPRTVTRYELPGGNGDETLRCARGAAVSRHLPRWVSARRRTGAGLAAP